MSKQADDIGRQLEAAVAKAARALILQIDAELRKSPSAGGTPVDTGHARASWLPSIGAPSSVEGDEAQHASAVASLLTYQLAMGDLWLSNNAPYIQRLNMGSSTQAPTGFVELAMDRARVAVEARFPGVTLQLGVSGLTDAAGGTAAGNMAAAYSPLGGD